MGQNKDELSQIFEVGTLFHHVICPVWFRKVDTGLPVFVMVRCSHGEVSREGDVTAEDRRSKRSEERRVGKECPV